MDALEAIRTRRSIRKYTDRPVEAEKVQILLEAAMLAPSAGNQQPWRFIVIDDKALLEKVPEINPNAPMAPKAPMAILVCGDLRLERFPGNWTADCSAAAENLLIAARALGLGAVWTGLYPEEDRVEGFRDLLGLPREVVPLALIPVGYPATESGPVNRFREDRVHKNGW
jgi:nitroreductase